MSCEIFMVFILSLTVSTDISYNRWVIGKKKTLPNYIYFIKRGKLKLIMLNISIFFGFRSDVFNSIIISYLLFHISVIFMSLVHLHGHSGRIWIVDSGDCALHTHCISAFSFTSPSVWLTIQYEGGAKINRSTVSNRGFSKISNSFNTLLIFRICEKISVSWTNWGIPSLWADLHHP